MNQNELNEFAERMDSEGVLDILTKFLGHDDIARIAENVFEQSFFEVAVMSAKFLNEFRNAIYRECTEEGF